VTNQFLELATVAQECRATIVFLAAQVDHFPDHVKNKIEQELSGRIFYLLLNNSDLEAGPRAREGGQDWEWLRMIDFVSSPFPETQSERTPGPRQIIDPFSIFTKGGGNPQENLLPTQAGTETPLETTDG
jgi:hypothetical protein